MAALRGKALAKAGFVPYVVGAIPILQEKARGRRADMPEKTSEDMAEAAGQAQARTISPAAERALAEAAARRAAIDARTAELAKARELNGRGGLEPVRYDDWEVKGIASDF